jgi:hypothetical protein
MALMTMPALADSEVMTDRCSSDVAIPQSSYSDRLKLSDAIILRRGSNGWSPSTGIIRVVTSRDGHIRWFCRDGRKNKWFAERSRCNSHTNVIRARLGPDRLLKTECLESYYLDPERQ